MPTTYKPAYGATTAVPITLASLAASVSLLAGRQSDAIDVAGLGAEDVPISVKVTTGASATGGPVEVWAFGSDDGTAWPTGLGAADAAVTLADAEFKNASMKLVHVFTASASGSQNLELSWAALRPLFGNALPRKVCLFVTQATGDALSATPADHAASYTPVNTQGVTS